MSPSKTDYYQGDVCFQDGWHYTVVDDPDARDRARVTAQAHLDYATKKLGADEVAAAQAELAHVEERDFHQPGERLVLEDRHVIASTGEPYAGPVLLVEGVEYALSGDPAAPAGEPVRAEGRYRLATDDDARSWQDRKHGGYALLQLEDGSAGLTVTTEDLEAIKQFLEGRKSG